MFLQGENCNGYKTKEKYKEFLFRGGYSFFHCVVYCLIAGVPNLGNSLRVFQEKLGLQIGRLRLVGY